MPGFAEEVQTMKTTTAPIVGGPAETAEPTEASPAVDVKKEETIQAPPKPAPIKIGTQTFDKPEDAIAYAEELERTLAVKDAYEQGKASAAPTQPAQEKDEFDELESEIFENPKVALKKAVEIAKKQAFKEIREAQEREIKRERTWSDFYSQNQDLADHKDLVDFVLEKNWKDVGNIDAKKALSIIAEKTRAMISSRKESTLPTKELPSGPAITTGATGSATATVEKKEDVAVDFISQLNKHRKRT